MTYGNRSVQCSESCSGWQSFRLVFGVRAGELQPLQCPLPRLKRRVDVALRHGDAAMPCDTHDRESVHS